MRYAALLVFVAGCSPSSSETPPGRDAGAETSPVDAAKDTASPPIDACTPTAWYLDADGDGFGAGDVVMSCDAPEKHVAKDGDCADDESLAFPGQTLFFEKPRKSGGFDFDCDGKEAPRFPNVGSCIPNGGDCDPSPAQTMFWSPVVPGCGDSGTFYSVCDLPPTPGMCISNAKTQRQECR
jgi:hypothetical protein